MRGPLRATAYLHLTGVGCSIASILLAGPLSHDTGVAMAIGTVTLLGVAPLPEIEDPERIDLVVGSVTDGGMRQGQFIKSCFAVALLASGWIPSMTGGDAVVSTLYLGVALGCSAVANEFEIRSLDAKRAGPPAGGRIIREDETGEPGD